MAKSIRAYPETIVVMRPSEKFEARAHAPKTTRGVVDATLRTFLAGSAFHRALQPAAIDVGFRIGSKARMKIIKGHRIWEEKPGLRTQRKAENVVIYPTCAFRPRPILNNHLPLR